ncbi:hypothetical protein MUP46_01205 [Patescibacteria group bacterium]|nr:hypothetical protein [Patescibacteria group bacterium]
MNTNLQNKTFKDPVSLDFQESNLKVNKNHNCSTSALISKGEISSKTNNPIKESEVCCPLTNSKDIAPHSKVSIDFAASQWFQILLIHINSKNKKLSGVLEPIPSGHLGLTG